jgi:hypothetical protein
MIRLILSTLIALVLTAASAQAQTAPPQVPTPTDGWFFHFPHDKVNLDHFEMRIDTPVFARATSEEVSAGEFEVAIPAMTPGVHVVAFRACATTVCSVERALPIEFLVTINAVGDISVVQRKR